MQVVRRPILSLTPHPGNPRRHPPEQLQVLRDSLRIHGQQRPVVITDDGTILAGHGLVEAATLEAWTEVECVVYTGPHPEAFLVMDNRSAELAYDDWDALDAMLADLFRSEVPAEAVGFDVETMARVAEQFAKAAEEDEQEPEGGDDEGPTSSRDAGGESAQRDGESVNGRPIISEVADELFATDNDFDVPCLDLAMQATGIDAPVVKWGVIPRRGAAMFGTYHFYTEDYKFSGLWRDPAVIPNTGCTNVVEPNFSTNHTMPRAVVLWGIYRKRWMARFWQKHGVKVFVDLNLNARFADIALLGVPRGWRAYTTRGYSREGGASEDVSRQYAQAVDHAGTEDVLFWVYGGGKQVEAWCKEHRLLYVPEHIAMATGARVGSEDQHEEVGVWTGRAEAGSEAASKGWKQTRRFGATSPERTT